MSVYENYLEVEKKVQEACKRAGRNREENRRRGGKSLVFSSCAVPAECDLAGNHHMGQQG